ncbi:hypothetical protein GCM10009095_25580 [Sphingomonas molluscorum]|nr:hypothetical protein GCM10017606_00750 [Microbacterium terregens]
MRNLLLEISALDPNTKAITVLRMAAAHAKAEGIYLDGETWLPAITSDPEIGLGYWGEGRAQALTASYGQINFELSRSLGNTAWPKLDFEGASATLWVGNMGDPFEAYQQFWTGNIGPLVQDSSREAHFSLLGVEAQLTGSALTRVYQGTGGVEGPSTMLGKLKPMAFGACVNVAPVLLDPIKWVYQVDAYRACPINAVYSSALTLGAPNATVATYAELVALTLTPGQWAACPNLGMFRLGGDPGSAKITADVGTADSAASIARRLVNLAGVLDARLGPSFTTGTRGYSLYLTEDATIGDLARDAAFAESRLLLTDSKGVLHLAPIASSKAPGTLASDGSALPFVRSDTIVQEAPASPAWRVKIGHTPVWSVHSANEISPAVATQGADLTAAIAAAEAARDRAEAAEAAAKLANERLDATVDDGILDRAEKRQWIAEFEAATAEFDGLFAEGQAQGATAEANAYASTFTTLSDYLATLNPAFADTSEDTPIDAATFKARFVNYYVARKNLDVALAKKAAQTAGWDKVTGPGKPEDNATVGAPPGTIVGDRPSEDLVKDVDDAKDNANDIRKQLPALVLPILKEPIDQISALHLAGSSANLKATKALHEKNHVAIEGLRTYVDENGALVAERFTQLTSRVGEAEETMEAGFLEINRTIADKEQALSESITDQIANYGETVTAALNEERRVRSTEDEALAETIEQLAATVTEGNETLSGQINDVRQLVVDTDTATGTRIDNLGVKIDDEVSEREAAIQTVEKAIVDATEALTERVDTISASVGGIDETLGEISGTIQTIQQTQADENGARAEEIQTLQSRLDNVNGATFEQKFSTFAEAVDTVNGKVNNIGAEYTVKLQTEVNGVKVFGGFGLVAQNGMVDAAFSVDAFRIYASGGTKQVFYADADGVYMPDVRVDRLKAGTIDFEFINRQSLQNPSGGYQILPGGFTIMWGQYRGIISDEMSVNITFPRPFTNALMSVSATPYIVGNNSFKDLWIQATSNRSKNGATFYTQAARSDAQSLDGFDWMAFGY